MSNAQKVAIVTGASQGIGAAIVQAFRSRNYAGRREFAIIKAIADPNVVDCAGRCRRPEHG